MSQQFNRRQFVGTIGLAATLGPALHATGQAPASERMRLALIGCGGRGRELLDVFLQYPDVEVPVVCDVNEPRMEQAAQRVAQKSTHNKNCEQILDYQRVLDRHDIDAVVIATTQHWHGLPFIAATQADKHVYVEKPLSHTVTEGRAMIDAAKKSRVITMMGSQQHNYPHYVQAEKIIRSGRLGKICAGRVLELS